MELLRASDRAAPHQQPQNVSMQLDPLTWPNTIPWYSSSPPVTEVFRTMAACLRSHGHGPCSWGNYLAISSPLSALPMLPLILWCPCDGYRPQGSKGQRVKSHCCAAKLIEASWWGNGVEMDISLITFLTKATGIFSLDTGRGSSSEHWNSTEGYW